MFRRIVTIAAGATLAAGVLIAAGGGVQAAGAATPIPSLRHVDCATCDQQNAKGDGKSSGFFFDFVCSMNGRPTYIVTYYNKGTGSDVATVNGETVTVPAGGKHTFYVPAVPGAVTVINRSSVTTGGKTVIPVHATPFDCPCTAPPTTVPPTTIPPTTVLTTVPPTIAPPVSIVRPPPTTVPPRELPHVTTTVTAAPQPTGTLPATGRDTSGVVTLGLILTLLGGLALAASGIARARKAD